jgi:hypothetical protein
MRPSEASDIFRETFIYLNNMIGDQETEDPRLLMRIWRSVVRNYIVTGQPRLFYSLVGWFHRIVVNKRGWSHPLAMISQKILALGASELHCFLIMDKAMTDLLEDCAGPRAKVRPSLRLKHLSFGEVLGFRMSADELATLVANHSSTGDDIVAAQEKLTLVNFLFRARSFGHMESVLEHIKADTSFWNAVLESNELAGTYYYYRAKLMYEKGMFLAAERDLRKAFDATDSALGSSDPLTRRRRQCLESCTKVVDHITEMVEGHYV